MNLPFLRQAEILLPRSDIVIATNENTEMSCANIVMIM